MKTEFDNFSQQMGYINKIILRNTDLKKICQYCGKPAQIRYSYKDPYDVQFICAECKRKYKLNKIKGLVPDLEVIHIKEHFIDSKREREEKLELNQDNMKKIQDLLNTNLPKGEALRQVGFSIHQYNKLVELYKAIDNDIENKLNKVFNKNRAKRIKNSSFNRLIEIEDNNLAKLKKERKLSNRDIVKLSNNQIQICALSNISLGKTIPTMKTKCLLAEIFKVSVADIFPKEWLYSTVYKYEDYIRLNANVRMKLYELVNNKKANNEKYIFEVISNKCGLSTFRLYEFLNNKNLMHDELVLLVSNLF